MDYIIAKKLYIQSMHLNTSIGIREIKHIFCVDVKE